MAHVSRSIVVPAKDEAESLPALLAEIAQVMGERDYEVIVVDDGSTDGTPEVLKALRADYPFLRHLRHDRSAGKSAAILTGVRAARGDLIATLDADGQNDPSFLPGLFALASEPGVGVAAGQRIRHAHSQAKRLASRWANGLRARLLNDNTRDTACGLKAFRRDVFLRFPYFDTMHRFLPALALREGLEVRHLDVVDRLRTHGQSKYGLLDRAAAGALDLFGVLWLLRRRKRIPQSSEVGVLAPPDRSAP